MAVKNRNNYGFKKLMLNRKINQRKYSKQKKQKRVELGKDYLS